MHENIIHGSFHDPYGTARLSRFVCIIDGEHMSFGKGWQNAFIDQDVNSMINDPIKKYLGCWQQNKHYFPDFLWASKNAWVSRLLRVSCYLKDLAAKGFVPFHLFHPNSKILREIQTKNLLTTLVDTGQFVHEISLWSSQSIMHWICHVSQFTELSPML